MEQDQKKPTSGQGLIRYSYDNSQIEDRKLGSRLPTLRKTGSPPRLHTDLGDLSIGERQQLSERLRGVLSSTITSLWPGNPQILEDSLKAASRLPKHFLKDSGSTPSDLLNPKVVARHVVRLVQLVGKFKINDYGVKIATDAGDIALPGRDQNEHIKSHLRGLLAECLMTEMNNSQMTEANLLTLYQRLSNKVRQVAILITRDEDKQASFELIGKLIEELPDIEGPMLTARFSTSLNQDLFCPCIGYYSDARIAEVLKNTGIAMLNCKRSGNAYGGVRLEKCSQLLRKITDSISDRIEAGDLNLAMVFRYLESLKYGETAIRVILDESDDSMKEILMRSLIESGCFKDLIREEMEETDPGSDRLEDNYNGRFDTESFDLDKYLKGRNF